MVTKDFWRHPDLIVPSSLAFLATSQTYRDSQALAIIYFLYCCDKYRDQKQLGKEQVYTTLHFKVRKHHRVMSGQESQVMNLEAEPEADITEDCCLPTCFPFPGSGSPSLVCNQDSCPGNGVTHSGLDLPTPINNPGTSPHTWPQASLREVVMTPSGDSGLCYMDS